MTMNAKSPSAGTPAGVTANALAPSRGFNEQPVQGAAVQRREPGDLAALFGDEHIAALDLFHRKHNRIGMREELLTIRSFAPNAPPRGKRR